VLMLFLEGARHGSQALPQAQLEASGVLAATPLCAQAPESACAGVTPPPEGNISFEIPFG